MKIKEMIKLIELPVHYFGARSVVVLLAGGDKHTQTQDIKQALELAKDL